MKPIIFAGNSNLPLAQNLAGDLGLDLGKMEIIRFADSECRVRVLENVADREVFLVQSFSNPVDEHLVEFMLMCDAVKRSDAGKVIAVVPYHGYSRQDRMHREGECLSAQLVARLLETAGFDKLITVELHSEGVIGFFKIPVKHVLGFEVFINEVRKRKENACIVTPDAGALKRAQKFAENIDSPLALIEKKRDLSKPHTILSMKVVGDVKGKTAIIVDDVIVTGGTLVNAAYMLKENGASKVIACATHADFVGGADKILNDSPLDEVWVSDTIKIPQQLIFRKLRIFPVSGALAGEMAKMIRP